MSLPLSDRRTSEQLRHLATNLTDDLSKTVRAFTYLAVFLFVIVLFTAISHKSLDPILWASASGAMGAGLGFLFGIPKVLQIQPLTENKSPSPLPIRANTNLEEISDWATKIIVGLTLANLKQIVHYLLILAGTIARSMHGTEATALALLLMSSIPGFVFSYLVTRLFLQLAIGRADAVSQNPVLSVLTQTLKQEAKALAAAPEDQQLLQNAADHVENITNNPDVIRLKIQELAREYEQKRASLSPGNVRTIAMENIVFQLKALHQAGYSLLSELMSSSSVGERLAAIAFLEARPAVEHLSWLRERVEIEQPFLVYHVAAAFKEAARVLPSNTRSQLQDEILKCQTLLEQKGLTETDRFKMFNAAAQVLASQS